LSRAQPISSTPYKTQSKLGATRLCQIEFDLPEEHSDYSSHVAQVLDAAENKFSWLKEIKLVAKPDQLIKRRGKAGLLKLNADWRDARKWIEERAGTKQQVEHVSGYLRTFLVEPFVPHPQDTEYYINIMSVREGDWILFTHEGGVDVGDVDEKAEKLLVPVDLEQFPSRETIAETLLSKVPSGVHDVLIDFISRLYAVYVECQFTYLEINPLVVVPDESGQGAAVHYLDLAAKLDQTAEFEAGTKWAVARAPANLGYAAAPSAKVSADHGPPMEFPAPFGRELSKEEQYIADLDAKTGASLKLTILNSEGRIWTLVAGGGASVVYADAIAANGFSDDLANYGEYSGAPSETQTYEYAKTVFDLMTRGTPHPDGKILFIGGGIANFTNVASTFKGIIRALKDYASAFHTHNVQIWVRRAGPNFPEGLRSIKAAAGQLNLPMKVYGPEVHVSGIVPMALGKKEVLPEWSG
jgi:ATP citrate (pro-S)-lyase